MLKNTGIVYFSFFDSKGEFDISAGFEVKINEDVLERNVVVCDNVDDENNFLYFHEDVIMDTLDRVEEVFGTVNLDTNPVNRVSSFGGYTHKIDSLTVSKFMRHLQNIIAEYVGEDNVGEIQYFTENFREMNDGEIADLIGEYEEILKAA